MEFVLVPILLRLRHTGVQFSLWVSGAGRPRSDRKHSGTKEFNMWDLRNRRSRMRTGMLLCNQVCDYLNFLVVFAHHHSKERQYVFPFPSYWNLHHGPLLTLLEGVNSHSLFHFSSISEVFTVIHVFDGKFFTEFSTIKIFYTGRVGMWVVEILNK